MSVEKMVEDAAKKVAEEDVMEGVDTVSYTHLTLPTKA